MYGCHSCYSVVQVWRHSVLMSSVSVTEVSFFTTCLNNLFWVFLLQNLSCCYILWYWQEATYIQAKYGHLDYMLPQASKLPQLRTDDVPVVIDIAFLPAHLLARLRMIHESRDAIKYRSPIGRNQKPSYDKHVFLLSSTLQFTVILCSKRSTKKRDVLAIFHS